MSSRQGAEERRRLVIDLVRAILDGKASARPVPEYVEDLRAFQALQGVACARRRLLLCDPTTATHQLTELAEIEDEFVRTGRVRIAFGHSSGCLFTAEDWGVGSLFDMPFCVPPDRPRAG